MLRTNLAPQGARSIHAGVIAAMFTGMATEPGAALDRQRLFDGDNGHRDHVRRIRQNPGIGNGSSQPTSPNGTIDGPNDDAASLMCANGNPRTTALHANATDVGLHDNVPIVSAGAHAHLLN